MRTLATLIISLLVSVSATAQIEVVEIERQADTLMFVFNSGMETINVYKNPNGYFLAEKSTNMFDPIKRFYLGKDKAEACTSVKTLLSFCGEDVETTIKVLDAMGQEYVITTDMGLGGCDRRPTPQVSNMIWLQSIEMAGWVRFSKKCLEELLSRLS